MIVHGCVSPWSLGVWHIIPVDICPHALTLSVVISVTKFNKGSLTECVCFGGLMNLEVAYCQ